MLRRIGVAALCAGLASLSIMVWSGPSAAQQAQLAAAVSPAAAASSGNPLQANPPAPSSSSNGTHATLELGGGWESDPARQTPDTGPDWLGLVHGEVTDVRDFWDTQWRTEGQVTGDYYASQGTYNYAYAGGTFGPVLYVNPDIRVHPDFGLGTSLYSNHWFYNEASGGIAVETDYFNSDQAIRFRFGCRDYNDQEFPATKGCYGEITGQVTYTDLVRNGDVFNLSPEFRHSNIGGTGFTGSPQFEAVQAGKYDEIGGKASYYVPVSGSVVIGGGFSIQHTQYSSVASPTTGVPAGRRDLLYGPTASVILENFFGKSRDWRFDYAYDINQSTEAIDAFSDHTLTTSVVMRF
jgi:hypothetical protein